MNSRLFQIWPLAILLSLSWLGTSECLEYRLGSSVLPTFYNLSITVKNDVINPTTPSYEFNGQVDITLYSVDANVKQITLHMEVMDITACSLRNSAGNVLENIQASQMTHVQPTQQLTVPLTQALVANQSYILHFEYTGYVNTDPMGLFATSYMDEKTMTTKWLLLTHMQAINARRVFPCFDEPAFKAKFQLHIGRPSNFNSTISNTQLLKTTNDNNQIVDHFEVTPIMSTYLLAFVISEYSALGNMYTRPSYADYIPFSHGVAESVLPAFNELFQQSYQDLGNEVLQYATTPNLTHDSMENWGLIIFKDKVILQEPGYTDGWTQKEFTIRNIVHENAHMWFGNSVTVKWWGFLWMQEGFARYYEYFMGHQLYPDYQLDQQFVVHKLQHIFRLDSTNQTQTLTSGEANVITPKEIENKFDSITFAKGASIVRMWRNGMGSENFDRAIQNYLKEFHLQNVLPSNLVEHIRGNWPGAKDVMANYTLNQFFGDFTVRVGYPVVTVYLSDDNKVVNLEQQRFLLNPHDGSDPNVRYTVPITFTSNLSPDFENLTVAFFMDRNVGTYTISYTNPIDWVIINKKQSNYHRVWYKQPLMGRIQKALTETNHSKIPAENRAAFIDDLFNFAHAKMIDYVEVFEFMEYMSTELDYIPWYSAYEGLSQVAKRFTPQQLPNFNKYLSDITVGVFKKLGVSWSDEDKILDVYNRNKQVGWLCKYKSEECHKQLELLLGGNASQPTPDYWEAIYCAASRSNASAYEAVLGYYQMATNFVDRERNWRAASCTREYKTHYQNQIIGQGSNSVDFKLIALAQLYEQNPDLITPIFQMVIEDISQLAKALDSWQKTAQAISDMADYFTTREQRTMLSDFYVKNEPLFGISANLLEQALYTVDANLAWAENRLGPLNKYLARRNGAAGLAMATTTLMMTMMLTLVNLVIKR